MKHSANILTASRIFFAAGMVLTAPFSAAFWVCYLGGGVSDLLDGPVARALHIQSEVGAKLDSAADLYGALVEQFVRYVHHSQQGWMDNGTGGILGG